MMRLPAFRSGTISGSGPCPTGAEGLERLPEGRDGHIDLMKCVALCFIPLLHVNARLVLDGLAAEGFPPGWFSAVLGAVYNIVPGILLFCMGRSVVLTRHGSPGELAKRGVRLLRLSVLLDLVRAVPFYLIRALAFSDPSELVNAWKWLLGSDVLPFAGLCFLVFAGVRVLHMPDWAVLAVGAACAAGQQLLPVPELSGTGGYLLGNLIFVQGGESYFPLISWLVYPCMGYFYQSRLRRTKDPARFHLRLGLACAGALAVSAALLCKLKKWRSRFLLWGEDTFRMDLPTVWFSSLVAGVWVSVSWFLAQKLERLSLRRLVSWFGERLTVFYCIHWVVVMGIMLFRTLGGKKCVRRVREALALGAAVFAVSTALTGLWDVFRCAFPPSGGGELSETGKQLR